MDFHIYLSLLLLYVLRSVDAVEVEFHSDPDVHWENFKKAFEKSYEASEEALRRESFENNFRKISEHNQRYEQGMHSFELGLNEYADMMIEDFVKIMNGFKRAETRAPIPFIPPSGNISDSMDWRDAGAVTAVKNQKQCGSCFAFSATGCVEGQNKMRHGELISLSEQNIIDCSRPEGNQGCNGGQMDNAFKYMMMNQGLDTEQSYPYKAKEGRCHYKPRDSAVKHCFGYSDIVPRDEETLKKAAGTVGPISVAIDASHDSFQMYKRGIYDEPLCSTTQLDHGVLVVGYGSENGTDYWIVKNSWGADWGEDGYIRMSRNKDNQCGIATEASFAVI